MKTPIKASLVAYNVLEILLELAVVPEFGSAAAINYFLCVSVLNFCCYRCTDLRLERPKCKHFAFPPCFCIPRREELSKFLMATMSELPQK